jgi:hypothetical protein
MKTFDTILPRVPLVGVLSGFISHLAILVTRPDGVVIIRMQEQPSFFEGKYTVEKLAQMDKGEEMRVLLSLLAMALQERRKRRKKLRQCLSAGL